MKRIGFIVAIILSAAWTIEAADDDRDVDRDDRDENYIHDGLWELNLSVLGSWIDVEESDVEVTTIGGRGSIGYCITDWLEVGVKSEGNYTLTDFDVGETESTFILGGPEVILNLPTRSFLVPFGFASGGVAYTNFNDIDESDTDEVGAYWEAGAGLRIFANRWAAITLRAAYQQLLFEDIDDEDAVVGSVGISLFF